MPISYLLRPSHLRIVLLMGCVLAGSLRAQEGEPGSSTGLSIETIAERRVVAPSSDGAQVKFVAADQLHIGDEIFYTVRVQNVTNSSIEDAVIVRAVPRNTQYVADSAVGPATRINVSIDGGTTFSVPGELEIVTTPRVTRPATASDYTHIRWQLQHPLAPGATALLRFRGIFK